MSLRILVNLCFAGFKVGHFGTFGKLSGAFASRRPEDFHHCLVSRVLRRQQWAKVAPELEARGGHCGESGWFEDDHMEVSYNGGYPKMDDLYQKILLKWMIWGYPPILGHLHSHMGLSENRVPLNPLDDHNFPYQNSYLRIYIPFSDTVIRQWNVASWEIPKILEVFSLGHSSKNGKSEGNHHGCW